MKIQDQIIVENKAVESLLPIHKAQLLTYLKLSNLKLGFLLQAISKPSIRFKIKADQGGQPQ